MKMRRGSSDSLLIIILLLAAGYWYFYLGGAAILTPNSVVNTVTITFKDGSEQTFNSPSLAAQQVAVVGSTVGISTIRFDTRVTPTLPAGTTSVTGVTWTVTGAITSGITGGSSTSRLTISPVSSPPTTLTSGTAVTIASTTVTEAQLMNWVPLDYNNYDIKANVSVQANFNEPGTTRAVTIDGAAASTVQVKNVGFPATLSVTISPTVTTK